MSAQTSDLIRSVLRRIFDKATNLAVWEDHGIYPSVTADVRFRFDGPDLHDALLEGDRYFVEEIKRNIGGGNIAWDNTLRAYVRERGRHLSLKAGRRSGRHKRLVEAPNDEPRSSQSVRYC